MSKQAIKTLIESSKATVVVGALIVLGVLVYLGKIEMAWFQEKFIWLISVWMGAHTVERSAKHLATKKKEEPDPPEPQPAEENTPADEEE